MSLLVLLLQVLMMVLVVCQDLVTHLSKATYITRREIHNLRLLDDTLSILMSPSLNVGAVM